VYLIMFTEDLREGEVTEDKKGRIKFRKGDWGRGDQKQQDIYFNGGRCIDPGAGGGGIGRKADVRLIEFNS